MSRLARFESYRHIGARDTMVFYDCDDPDQLAELEARATRDDLIQRKLVQAFAPDTAVEAKNRGYRPVRSSAL